MTDPTPQTPAPASAAEVLLLLADCGETINRVRSQMQVRTGGVLPDTLAERAAQQEAARRRERGLIDEMASAQRRLWDLASNPAHLRALAAQPAPTPVDAGLREALREVLDHELRLANAMALGDTMRMRHKAAGRHHVIATVRDLLAQHPTPPAGAGVQQARHIKTGKVYAVVGRAKHKALGERWVDTILYRNDAGELFSRELGNFEQSFELNAQAQAEGDEAL